MNGLTVKKNSLPGSILAVIVGALLMGMLWRVRGAHGWGSSWGLLNVGFVFTTYIICLLGGRNKLGLGWLAITSIVFMLTTSAWGTMQTQITGLLSIEFEGTFSPPVPVSVFSAVFLMFCIGFGLASLYGLLLGRAYSSKPWKLWHFAAVLLVFYAVLCLSKAFLAHAVMNIIQPQIGKAFSQGLINAGENGSAWKGYLNHFNNEAWAKKIYGGRNYFASVKAISSAIAAAAAILAVRFIVKDKKSAKIGTGVCLAFGSAITVSELFFFFAYGGYHAAQGFLLPGSVSPGPMWEYLTGFIAGGIITAIMMKMNTGEDVDDCFIDDIPSVLKEIFTFLFGYIVLIGINVVRPVILRYDNSVYQIFFIIGSAVLAIALIAVVAVKCGININRVDTRCYSAIMLMLAVLYDFTAYMFIGTSAYVEITEISMLHNILVCISFAVVMTWAVINFIKVRKLK